MEMLRQMSDEDLEEEFKTTIDIVARSEADLAEEKLYLDQIKIEKDRRRKS